MSLREIPQRLLAISLLFVAFVAVFGAATPSHALEQVPAATVLVAHVASSDDAAPVLERAHPGHPGDRVAEEADSEEEEPPAETTFVAIASEVGHDELDLRSASLATRRGAAPPEVLRAARLEMSLRARGPPFARA